MGLGGLGGLSGFYPQGLRVAPGDPPVNIPTMTSSNSPAPFVTSQSSELNSYLAWRLFDGQASGSGFSPSRWLTAKGSEAPSWVAIDLGQPYLVSSIRLWSGSVAGRFPRNWTLQSSPNGTNWEDQLVVTGDSSGGAYTAQAVRTLPSPVGARYWRVFVSFNNGDREYTSLFRVDLA